MPTDPTRLTASQALRRLRAGTLDAETYVRACLDRIAERDEAVRAWSHVDVDEALDQARRLDGLARRGPLHGLPIGIKDVILTQDMPTQYNSPIYRGHHPRLDAACVKILRAAGAVILGKTDTVEFAATGTKAATRNPHDLTRTPGGSSSGSAAAVADHHVPLALGTQTGGSMIRPAGYCGVWAMKPTWNLISAEGAKTFAVSLDTLGWFGRSAEDLGLMLRVFDPDAAPAPRLDLKDARIAVCRTAAWDQADAATRQAMAQAVQALSVAGAQVVDLPWPAPLADLVAAQKVIMLSEARAAFLAEHRTALPLLEQSLRDHVENRHGYSRQDLCRAYDLAARGRAVFDELAEGFDAVLTPSTVGEAPVGLGATGDYVFNGLWTLLHVPCVNVPGWLGPAGLPVGLTLTGPRFSDARTLAAAQALGRLLAG